MLLRRGILARLGGVAEPIWQWAVLERVSNGPLVQIELHDLAAGCLRVAGARAQAEPL